MTTTAPRSDQLWLDSLAALIPVPAPYRRADQSRATVSTTLRCDDRTLDLLIREGLPCEGPEGAERFDGHDIYNLGLYSGTRRSLPEYAAHFVTRLARADPATWLRPLDWTLRLRAGCGDPARCAGEDRWRVVKPVPEAYGGHVRQLSGHPPPEVTATSLEVTGAPGPIELTWRLTTAGVRRTLLSGRLRELMRWLVEDFRFQSLPFELASDTARLRQLGTADCVGGSLLMEEECRRLGIPAQARRTVLLGVMSFLNHGRLECVDEDGVEKALDPGLCSFARLDGTDRPDFEEFCHGSTSNRLIPLAGPPRPALATHGPDGGCPAEVDTRVSREDRTP
ncbi:hypothetical protein IAG44_01805 [Streptomyces roseirectus]|uniref:Uncharacterized protein n=1 Tax=Streptomyces roseirectus TaxID=2768066 RepID=A0A7H0I6B2_9ACTN|nr:hypothetical protein [Streptomyces roseirectus]QNP68328.1 hypothetical protein IAG44_01805 [Streptomyces roseirectus]